MISSLLTGWLGIVAAIVGAGVLLALAFIVLATVLRAIIDATFGWRRARHHEPEWMRDMTHEPGPGRPEWHPLQED